MNRSEAKRAIAIVRSFYPRMESGDDVVDMWEMMLSRFSFDDVKLAIASIMKRSRFQPNCADILRELESGTYEVTVDNEHQRIVVRTVTRGIFPFRCWNGDEARSLKTWLDMSPSVDAIAQRHQRWNSDHLDATARWIDAQLRRDDELAEGAG